MIKLMTEVMERKVLNRQVEHSNDRRFERFTYGTRYSDEIVKLSQVRGEQNIVSGELVTDIRNNGLINPLDIAIVSEELLVEYLNFVEKTWGSAAEIDEFAHLRQEDGTYSLLMAGHSREQAIEDIEEQDALETGVMVRHPIPVKIHDNIESVWDIIRIQLGENIHSQPPKERQAIALVEAFEFGGWDSVDDFLDEANIKNVTKGFMEKALQFRKLPKEIRSYVLAGPVPYYAGVELAQTVEPLKKYYAAKMNISGNDLEKQKEAIDMLVRQELSIICNRISDGKMNSTAAQAHVKKWRTHWVNETKLRMGAKKTRGGFDLEFVAEGPELYLKRNSAKIAQQLADMRHRHRHNTTLLITLADGAIHDKDAVRLLEEQTKEAEQAVERGRMALGEKARQGAEVLDLFAV